MNPKIQSITFDGVPPSVNSMYRNITDRSGKQRMRAKTSRYRTWLNAVNWQVAEQAPQRIDGEVEVSIFCKKTNKRREDIDNKIKAVLDLLVSNHLIEDDSKVVKVSASWSRNTDITGTLVIYEAAV